MSFIYVHNLHIFWYVCSKYYCIFVLLLWIFGIMIYLHMLQIVHCDGKLIKKWLEQVEIALARSKSYSSSHS